MKHRKAPKKQYTINRKRKMTNRKSDKNQI